MQDGEVDRLDDLGWTEAGDHPPWQSVPDKYAAFRVDGGEAVVYNDTDDSDEWVKGTSLAVEEVR